MGHGSATNDRGWGRSLSVLDVRSIDPISYPFKWDEY